ncbi:RagB/SusD family nutrient uptake outer membrane protein [Arcticibacter tournemirensis]|uniref:RagB/SusD family nutrient uptake outer membrane protein n=1 Tax=Arcticibacter tournemirensis TaxID=699437 RepID=A0A4Q0MEF0_9SPHI|nr:RagB/SusD family nutrient uptake outer membrane protein [Arcticibacter tournemirensis]RXF71216.1 RagB/SusD family nutrient uptake outer membrane protein [Arcticibacter tournemirensis]
MKLYYQLMCLVLFCTASISCKKYLDIVPDNVGTLDYAFRNRNEAENYLFGCYSTMQQLSEVTRNPSFTTSGEIVYPVLLARFFTDAGFQLIRGTQTTGDPILNYWSGSNHGLSMYKAIRRCNIMLENIDQPIDLKEPEKKRWIAEVKFLKAFYHYYLIRMYGPVILIKENNPIDVNIEETKRKRATLDESFEYVFSLMDEAIPDLPVVIENKSREFGRITKFIAMSLKAEMLATAASPLFNGNPDYANYKDKDGRNLFPSAYDPQKWRKAADACKAAIEECEAQGIKLNDRAPTAGVGSVSDEMKRVLVLQATITQRWEENPELIWALNYGFGYQGFTIPKLTTKAVSMANTYPSNWAVPLSTADLFYTDKGVPINEDKTWDYANRLTPQVGDEAHKHYIKQGYQTAKGHFNRERRFYADIAFDGGIWFGNGQQDEEKAYHVESRGIFAVGGPKSLNSTNITGYWPKKLASYLSTMDETFTAVDFKLPLIRLAGLYLLYAETLNEAEGPGTEVYQYINNVRERAGLPGVRESWSLYSKNPGKPDTKEGLRQIIHQERRIELCFEGQIGWDLRRWKELQEVLSRPLQGWNINEGEAVNYYRPQTVVIPVFGLKDYLWPISTTDVIVNENLTQNPYW